MTNEKQLHLWQRQPIDPSELWDIVTATLAGDVVWKNYEHPPRFVICKRGEDPRRVRRNGDQDKTTHGAD